jgi:ketopantoate reductase
MTSSLLIVGSGAMANLFAGRLAASGVKVTVLGTWEEGLQGLRAHGVRIISSDNKGDKYPVRVVDNPSDCRGCKLMDWR